MKTYKRKLVEGFKKRGYWIVEIADEGIGIEWWAEERWVIENQKISSEYSRLVITFLNDLQWQNGRKIVYEIAISKDLMMDYDDRKSELLVLNMGRGNFEEKINEFWIEFDNKTMTK